MHLALNDIDLARTKKYGFANHCVILRVWKAPSGAEFILIRSSEMSYFTPKGKARLSVKSTYQIYISNISKDICWMSRHGSKSEAFSEIKRCLSSYKREAV